MYTSNIINSIEDGDYINKYRDFVMEEDVIYSIKEYSINKNLDYISVLTHLMIENNFDLSNLSKKTFESRIKTINLSKKYNKLYSTIYTFNKMILSDIQCFPIPEYSEDKDNYITYRNSWGESRTYGGDRLHEGTDIMASNNIRGYFPIVSMTDGIIEKKGWLEKGGYRIGIRSPGGAYFYYAHLYSYAENISIGDAVKAGELIGFMGDTGYSEIEGTTGNFPVHLHLGVYIDFEDKEISINPYYVLDMLR